MSDDPIKPMRGVVCNLAALSRRDLLTEAVDAINGLTARVVAAEAELDMMKNAGVIEVAIRNPSVSEAMKHWEARAEAAEKALAEVTAERDAQKRDVMKWFNRALENMFRTKAAEASIAAIERETLASLEKIACRHVTIAPLWWQVEARNVIRAMIEEKNDE